MRQPSSSGPASTVSKPSASSILVTVAFALASSPAMTRAHRVDVVERLDHLRLRKVRLQELSGRRRLVVELGDVPVTLRVIVVRVDNDLACEGLDRNAPVVLERDRDDDDVARLRRFHWR
jgi:hypothetical protein